MWGGDAGEGRGGKLFLHSLVNTLFIEEGVPYLGVQRLPPLTQLPLLQLLKTATAILLLLLLLLQLPNSHKKHSIDRSRIETP